MSKYKSYSNTQLEELLSNYLIDSWSFSKVSTFSRNEKAFEMSYIYRYRARRSSTTIAGEAYHEALHQFFLNVKEGQILGLPELESIAFAYIDTIKPNDWKLQKTTPSVGECITKATNTCTALLRNFLKESGTYLDNIQEVLFVENQYNEFLTINGVEIPLPCHAIVDLIVKTNAGKIALIDHKSKSVFSSEEEFKLTIGRQAITYAKCHESKTGQTVDEVWFVENKHSQNRDSSSQLNRFIVELNTDTRRLYEALLYEPLRKMITAVNDPDYVYVINDADTYIDRAELYEFWAKTMIAEVEEFNVSPKKKELISQRLRKIRDVTIATINPKVVKHFMQNAAQFIQYDFSNLDMNQQEKIEHVLRSFGSIVRVAHVLEGYSSNTYLLEVSAGLKIASLYSHRLDIANALNVSSVRMAKDLKVYQGKAYLPVEAAKPREKDLMFDPKYLIGMKIPLGMSNYGEVVFWDLQNNSTPHALICGATGSGKSVCIKSIIEYAIQARIKNIVIFDPKYEFLSYTEAATVINDIDSIEEYMESLVVEMEQRVKNMQQIMTLVIFDEFADAVQNSKKDKELDIKQMVVTGQRKEKTMFGTVTVPKEELKVVGRKKSLEENLKIILQKGRSCGFRVVAATQRASVNVITGDAKVNLPVQVCFRVPKEIDSKVVIDEPGAESLTGRGDGLIKSPEYNDVVRFQAFYKQ